MAIHDWTKVEAGIFHHFHHSWIEEIQRILNGGLLPKNLYAMAEQQAAGYGPDVLTLQTNVPDEEPEGEEEGGGVATATATVKLTKPKAKIMAQSDCEYYRRKKSSIVIRHVSGDRIVAMVEIISPGNKSSQNGILAFLDKTSHLLEGRIHLLIIDLFPPSKRDPNGIHSLIWQRVVDDEVFIPPEDKPLTLAAYESSLMVRAFVEPVAVNDPLPDMPLILAPDRAVYIPLEKTYQAAWLAVPERWRRVLEPDKKELQ